MNNDDKIQKQVEFILNQQARFDANIGRLEEKNAQIQEKHAQLQDIVGRLAVTTAAGLEALVEAQIRTEVNISTLTDRTGRLTEKMTALAEAQAQTDDRLNTLINVVERQISERNNGGPQH